MALRLFPEYSRLFLTMLSPNEFSYRTAEVTEAIQKGTLTKFQEKSSVQLKEIVNLVRNGLSAGLRNTLRSLLVIEIHAKGTSVILSLITMRNLQSLVPAGLVVVINAVALLLNIYNEIISNF